MLTLVNPDATVITVALENSVEGASCPNNKQYTPLHKTEFFNATDIHCIMPLPSLIPRPDMTRFEHGFSHTWSRDETRQRYAI